MVQLFYTTYISVDLATHKICFAKVGKGGIRIVTEEMLINLFIFIFC